MEEHQASSPISSKLIDFAALTMPHIAQPVAWMRKKNNSTRSAARWRGRRRISAGKRGDFSNEHLLVLYVHASPFHLPSPLFCAKNFPHEYRIIATSSRRYFVASVLSGCIDDPEPEPCHYIERSDIHSICFCRVHWCNLFDPLDATHTHTHTQAHWYANRCVIVTLLIWSIDYYLGENVRGAPTHHQSALFAHTHTHTYTPVHQHLDQYVRVMPFHHFTSRH